MDKLITALKENNEFLNMLLHCREIPEPEKAAIITRMQLNDIELSECEVQHA